MRNLALSRTDFRGFFYPACYQFPAKVKDNLIILSVFSRSLRYNGRMIKKILGERLCDA